MRRVLVVLGAGLLGCGTATPEPPPPNVSAYAQTTYEWTLVSRTNLPSVTIVFDTSATMQRPFDPADPACPTDCGAATPCPSSCRTNLDAARDAVRAIVDERRADVRWGLVSYPATTCDAPTTGIAPLSLAASEDLLSLARASDAIVSALDRLTPSAQAPLAATLRAAALLPTMNERQSTQALLFVTAGRDTCTAGTPGCAEACDAPADVLSVVEQARTGRGIRTAVVGVGSAALVGDASAALEALARAGDLGRSCFSDADCGADACGADFRCARASWALDELLRLLAPTVQSPGAACTFALPEPPERLEWMTVRLNGELVTAGLDTWDLTLSPPALNLRGVACQQAQGSSPAHPLTVQVRILNEVK